MAPLALPQEQQPGLSSDSDSSDPFDTSDLLNRLAPTPSQTILIYLLASYTIAILVLWNLPYLRHILRPFKLLAVLLHECSHALAGVATGAKIESMVVEPDEGGLTRMRGGVWWITLPAGYLGSSLWGSAMVFAAFDETASLVVSILIALLMLASLWWAHNCLTRVLTLLLLVAVILLVTLTFVLPSSSPYHPFVVLFLGIMSALYSLWDIVDDLVSRKVNESDASQFAKKCKCFPFSRAWGVIWFLVAVAMVLGSVLLALWVY